MDRTLDSHRLIVRQPISGPRYTPRRAGLENLRQGATDPRVIDAATAVCRDLQAKGVRHALTGGIAINVYGWPRSTRDVDVLIGPEAFTTAADGTATPVVELPESVNGVPVDYLPIGVAGDFLLEALEHPLVTEGIPVAPAAAVICTKLLRFAMRDQADIVEILKAALFDAAAVRDYLTRHAPMLVPRYDRLVAQAISEEGR